MFLVVGVVCLRWKLIERRSCIYLTHFREKVTVKSCWNSINVFFVWPLLIPLLPPDPEARVQTSNLTLNCSQHFPGSLKLKPGIGIASSRTLLNSSDPQNHKAVGGWNRVCLSTSSTTLGATQVRPPHTHPYPHKWPLLKMQSEHSLLSTIRISKEIMRFETRHSGTSLPGFFLEGWRWAWSLTSQRVLFPISKMSITAPKINFWRPGENWPKYYNRFRCK